MPSLTISKKDEQAARSGQVTRWSMDCKATVHLGDVSRGGLTRGQHRACDHDLGVMEKYVPCGIVDEGNGALSITFGSSYKTSDFIVDTLEARWNALDAETKSTTAVLQIKMDNGPESSGSRTQFLKRMVQFVIRLSAVGASWSCSGMGRN
jgi:hypothetical protein